MNLSRKSGYTIVELVTVIMIVAIISTYIAIDVGSTPNSVRFEQTRAKLEAIRTAILGDDTYSAEGQRIHFGYHGDMGRIPATLTELVTIGTQAAWAYDATLGFGAGWRGPYITKGVSGSTAITSDEWGTALVYNTSEPTPKVTSYGADKASGGSGFAKDIAIELPVSLRLATVNVISKDLANFNPNDLQMDYVSSGAITSTTASPNMGYGDYIFYGIPFGVRALRTTSTPFLGPKTVTIDRAEQVLSDFSFGRGSLGVSLYQAGLGGTSTKGFDNRLVMVELYSYYPEDRQLKSLTVNWFGSNDYVGAAKLTSFSLNGANQICNVTKGEKVISTSQQVLRQGNTTTRNSLELQFDSNMKAVTFTLIFEWVGSDKTDTVNITTPVSSGWGWGSAGTVDTNFGTNGLAYNVLSGIPSVANGNIQCCTPSLQTDGKIVVPGYTSGAIDFAITRFHFNGSLDTGFGTAGVARSDLLAGTEYAGSSAVDNAGRILVAGTNSNIDILVTRYSTRGDLDSTFGTAGAGYVKHSGAVSTTKPSIFIQSDGKILVGKDNGYVKIWRFWSNGALDTGFATAGVFYHANYGGAARILVDTSGRIIAGGSAYTGAGDTAWVLRRISTQGILDTSFGTAGRFFWNLTTGGDALNDYVIQTDGKIVGAGNYFDATTILIARLQSNGTLDTNFGTAGYYLDSTASNPSSWGIALGPQNKIIAAHHQYRITRLLSDGRLDTSFGTQGRSFSGNLVPYQGVFHNPRGQICIAGSPYAIPGSVGVRCVWP